MTAMTDNRMPSIEVPSATVDFHSALIVGASQGIGLAFVKQLLQTDRPTKLYATYRQTNTATELLTLGNDKTDRLVCLPMDVTDEAQKSLRQLTAEHLLHYFQVNSIATALLAKHLLPLLHHADRSVFASISAKLGSIGDNQLGGWYGYRASKAALNMLIRTIAIEYHRRSPNTIVVALHPGTTDTRLSKPFQKNVPLEKLFSTDRTVIQLLNVIANLNPSDSGEFFSWDGSRLPW
jgi:NAD(P)-dependent dehydrogenase (short-subunit alcohol dehydrogenase family)